MRRLKQGIVVFALVGVAECVWHFGLLEVTGRLSPAGPPVDDAMPMEFEAPTPMEFEEPTFEERVIEETQALAVVVPRKPVAVEVLLDNQIRVVSGKWYDAEQIEPRYGTVRSLLAAQEEHIREPRACLENIIAKLAASTGDHNWHVRWTPEWSDECRQLVLLRKITAERGGFSLCTAGKDYFKSSDFATSTRLLQGVLGIACVTQQRVYAEVDRRFLSVLEDKTRFGQSGLDAASAHERPLRDFLSDSGVDQEQFEIFSWREKRARGSLQCVLAKPKPKSEYDRFFVDIDIDEWNPYADLIQFLKHQTQNTNHVSLQDEGYFLRQNGREVLDYLLRIRKSVEDRPKP